MVPPGTVRYPPWSVVDVLGGGAMRFLCALGLVASFLSAVSPVGAAQIQGDYLELFLFLPGEVR